MASQATGADILMLDTEAVRRHDFRLLLHPGDKISDVVRVAWVSPHHVRFQCPRHAWPIAPRVVGQFRRFSDMLVHNYSGILLLHNRPLEVQPRPPTYTEWSVSVTEDGLRSLLCAPIPGVQLDLGPVATLRIASRLARRHEPTLVRFDPHPLLDPFAPIWTYRSIDQRPTPPTRARHAGAHAELAGRARRALTDDPLIGAALATVSWQAVHKLPASSSAQRLLFHKVKGLRLSGWVRASSRRGCPHCAPGTT